MQTTLTKVAQTSALLIGASALVFSSAGMAGATAGDDAVVSATLDCGDLTVTSTKDISNLVVVVDGAEVKFDDLDGTTLTYTAEQLGGEVTGVYVKSGNNSDETDDATSTGEYVTPTESGVDCGDNGVVSGDDDDDAGDDDDDVIVDDDDDVIVEDDDDASGDDAVVDAVLECGELTVTSTKDISNVVVVFSDGSEQKFDDLDGFELVYGPEDLDDGEIAGVYIKSGNNSDGTGANGGYGEFVTVTDTGAACEVPVDDDDDVIIDDDDDVIIDDEDDDVILDDDDDDDDVIVDDDDDVMDDEDGNELPVVEVEDEDVLNPVTPLVPVAVPAAPAAPANPAVRPAAPAAPAQPAVLAATATPDAQVLGAQVTRAPGQLARTGDGTTNLVPFGLGLVLLGFGIQRSSKRFAGARVR